MFAASSGTVGDMFAASSGWYGSLLLARYVFGVLNVGTTEEETLRPNYADWDDCAAASITPETPRQLVLSIR